MSETRQKLKEETTKKIQEIDRSIIHWSTMFARATMAAREMENNIKGLYDFKKNMMIEDLKSQGVNIEKSEISMIDSETVVIVSIDEPKSDSCCASNPECAGGSCDSGCKCT